MNIETKPTVSVEELLRMKRAEQPPPEFWEQFERELRAKQLAAIMVRPPVWARFGSICRSVLSHPVALGATGALALAWVGMHEFRPATLRSRTVDSASAPVAVASVPTVAASVEASRPSVGAEFQASGPQEVAMNRPAAVVASTAAESAPRSDDDAIGLLTGDTSPLRIQPGAFAHTLFATAEPAAQWLGSSSSASVVAVREPLARMEVPDEVRARLLESDLPFASRSTADNAQVSTRLVSSLSDDRLYEAVQRYGLGGDHLLIKF